NLGQLRRKEWFKRSSDKVPSQVFLYTYDSSGNLLSGDAGSAAALDSQGGYAFTGTTRDGFTYNAHSQVSTSVDPYGVQLTYSYNGSGNQKNVSDNIRYDGVIGVAAAQGATTASTYDIPGVLETRTFGYTDTSQPSAPRQVELAVEFTYGGQFLPRSV